MTNTSWPKAGILAVLLVLGIVVSWEIYVRNHDFDNSFDDNPALWSYQRDRVYEPGRTIFIGSSRIKFDLDIPLWDKLTGSPAVQLACVGSSPALILDNLAADENFKGRLIIDVTEVLFFSDAPFGQERPRENLAYYKDRTPSQRVSFLLNKPVESALVFLDKDRLSMNAMLDELRVPNRPGVFQFPLFPPGFGRVHFSRQEYMTDECLRDTNQINQVRGVWAFLGKMSTEPPASGAKLDSMMTAYKKSVDKIKARGGHVIFVRTPSSGPFLMGETMGYPREKYWDRLLKETGCAGIHFADYEVIAHFECPEFSHLSTEQAKVFTKEFVRILQEEKGWSYSKKTAQFINH